MTFSEETVCVGLALSQMEWQRLARRGVLHIGDRIRWIENARGVAHVVNLAPDLGDERDHYVFALVSNKFRSISPDQPHVRILEMGNVKSFHLMTQCARPLLQERAQDLGLKLLEPIWDDDWFFQWQGSYRCRGLRTHEKRLRREFGFPKPDGIKVKLVTETVQADVETQTHNIGTPAFGWAIAFGMAKMRNETLIEQCRAFIERLRKQRFDAEAFFPVTDANITAIAEELGKLTDPKPAVPLVGVAWLRQLGHMHHREQPPTEKAFRESLTWLATKIGSDWAACFLKVYCSGSVHFKELKQMAWPVLADLSPLKGTRFTSPTAELSPSDGDPKSLEGDANDKPKGTASVQDTDKRHDTTKDTALAPGATATSPTAELSPSDGDPKSSEGDANDKPKGTASVQDTGKRHYTTKDTALAPGATVTSPTAELSPSNGDPKSLEGDANDKPKGTASVQDTDKRHDTTKDTALAPGATVTSPTAELSPSDGDPKSLEGDANDRQSKTEVITEIKNDE